MSKPQHPPKIDYRTRVTVDIDHYDRVPRLRLLRAYHNMRHAGATEVKVAVSSGGKGYHVEGLFSQRLSDEDQIKMRRNFCDDSNRIYMDIIRARYGHTDNVMWYTKSTNDGVRQRFETPEDAMNYVSMTRKTDAERAAALVKYGHKAVKDTSMPQQKNLTKEQ